MKRAFIPTVFDTFLTEETFPSLFNKILTPTRCSGTSCSSGVNLYEEGESFIVEAEVAGSNPEDVQIFLDRGGISIEAKKTEEKTDVKYHLKSTSSSSYWVPLPEGQIDESSIPEAICKNGILKITIPKSKASKPLKIAVKSA